MKALPTITFAGAFVTVICALLAQLPGDIQTADEKQPPPELLQAVWTNDTDRVEALLQSGADVNAHLIYGETALAAAINSEQRHIAELLLEHHADPNIRIRTHPMRARPTDGWTSLFFAVSRQRFELVELLLKYGAKPDLKDDKGESPLDLARELHFESIAKQIEQARLIDKRSN